MFKNNTIQNVNFAKCSQTWLSMTSFLFIILILALPMNDAIAEEIKTQAITVEMVDDYLNQALTYHEKGIERYEKGYLETPILRDSYIKIGDNYSEEIKDRKEELKAGIALLLPEGKRRQQAVAAYVNNITLYRKLTGLNIKNYNTPVKNIYFQLAVAEQNLADVEALAPFKHAFYGNKTGKELEKSIQKERDKNLDGTQQTFIRSSECSINMNISLLDVRKSKINSDLNYIKRKINHFFFKGFGRVSNIHGLPTIAINPKTITDLQPLDIAFIKALYSDDIHSGMAIRTAQPILKKHMLNFLNLGADS